MDLTENPLDQINPVRSNKKSQNKPLAVEILNQYPTLRRFSELKIPISLHILENQAIHVAEIRRSLTQLMQLFDAIN